jgi:hypothetical protein
MCWKEDNESFILVLVRAPEVSWIIRVGITYFGPSQPCIMLGLKPRLRTPPPGRPQP